MSRAVIIPEDPGGSRRICVYQDGAPREYAAGKVYMVPDELADALKSAGEVLKTVRAGGARANGRSLQIKLLNDRLDGVLKRLEALEVLQTLTAPQTGEYELLERYTVSSNGVIGVDRSALSLRAAFLRFSIGGASAVLSPGLYAYFEGSDRDSLNCEICQGIHTSARYYCAQIAPENGYWRMRYMLPQPRAASAAAMISDPSSMFLAKKVSELPRIRRIRFSAGTHEIPPGSVIEFWGIR